MRLVVALGGNAIAGERGADPESQQQAVEGACAQIAELIRHGHEVVITHGNGPQVGDLLRGVEAALDKDLTAARLARTVGADVLLVATDVEPVAIGYVPDRQEWLDFARHGGRSVITSLERLRESIEGSVGTRV